ncbi:hypothetical protein [Jiulongibacter sediminis]|uniref:hypothetical protein n=1 Tax=Jiulongibacter sediminis TaxID=1605367 RepID=UPI0006DC02B5|nr:hypothetical protein [Jiulongibacter sediminis]
MARSSGLLKIAFLCSGILISTLTSGQGLFSRQNVINQYTTVGIGGGSSHYWGDLSPYSQFYNALYTNVRWNGHANYTRYLTANAGVRLQLSWIRILGDDYTYSQRNLDLFWQNYIRNLHFRNDLKEVTISGVFNLLPSYGKGGARGRLDFTPYATIGLGMVAHSPQATLPVTNVIDPPTWVPLRDASTSGQVLPASTIKMYSFVEPVLPVGLGLRFKINEKFDITFEGNIRLTKTDFIDDVAEVSYADEALLQSFIGPNADLSFRADEAIHSRTRDYRISTLHQIWQDVDKLNAGILNPNTWSPSDLRQFYGPDLPGTIRGNASNIPDTYATFQVTLSYILSNKIKCPVLK